MHNDGSITYWIDQLKAGSAEAAGPLWNAYFARLVRLARERLEGVAGAAADAEDVALSAFKSFCLAAEKGRFPNLHDRDDLWRLLVVIAERKAHNLRRDQRRLKRGRAGLAPLVRADSSAEAALPPSRDPSPLFAAIMAEECDRLLRKLGDDVLRRIALDKLEGFSNKEIAARRDMALRTVERKLALIRRIWEEEIPAR